MSIELQPSNLTTTISHEAASDHPRVESIAAAFGPRRTASGRGSRAGVFVAPRVVRIGLLGYGRIGQAVAAIADHERVRLAAAGLELHITRALVRDLVRPRGGPPLRLTTSAAEVLQPGIDVLVEVLGGLEPARTIVAGALEAGIPVVSANKTLIATHGDALRALAARRRTTLAFDAAVLAGVPFLGSLARRPLVSAARRLEGILNGTSQFIVGALDRGASYERALAEAVERGYAEPDSSADTSGRDAAEKLAILLHLAGHGAVGPADFPRLGLDCLTAGDLAGARCLGGLIRPVALAAIDRPTPGAWVGPAFLTHGHPFSSLTGVENALRLTGTSGHTVTFAGPGAGPDATARTIVDDLVETITAGSARRSLAGSESVLNAEPISLREPPAGRWFLSTSTLRPSWGLPIERASVAADRIVALTSPLPWTAIAARQAAWREQGAQVLALPVL